MEQLQRCLITMSFVHIHIMHRSPNAWTNATQIHPPYLLLERALPCVALVTPSEAWRLRTSSWKIFPDFFASQKKDAHIISHRDWKTVGFTFRCSGKKHSFCTQVSITSALTIGLKVNGPSSSSSWWLLVHVTCDLGWSYHLRFMDLVSIALKALAKKLQQLENLRIN